LNPHPRSPQKRERDAFIETEKKTEEATREKALSEKKWEEEQEKKQRLARKRKIVKYQGHPIPMDQFAKIVVKHYNTLFHTDEESGHVLPLASHAFDDAKAFVQNKFPLLYKNCYLNYHCAKYLKQAKSGNWITH
jgi:hypothetical protein